MKTVAFLQNAWARRRPESDEVYEEHLERIKKLEVDVYTCYIGYSLFMGCMTGRRLEKVFGEEACNEIEWSNASRSVANRADGSFRYDVNHIRQTLDFYKPDTVLTFGNIAYDGVTAAREDRKFTLIYGPPIRPPA